MQQMRLDIDQDIYDMLKKESRRMGGNPSPDELAAIVQKAFGLAQEKQRTVQKHGIERAMDAGAPYGRPRKRKPKNWANLYEDWREGQIAKKELAKRAGVAPATVNRWLAEEAEKRAEGRQN
mgnify:CR=1 FL=1